MEEDNNIDTSFQDKLSRRSRTQEELRVLAVDDDHNILQLLKTALSAFQFDISIADSGANALKQISRAEKPFDCFLLDIQMPAMNGIMLCKEIRKLPEHKQSPILMLTAMSDREYVDLAFVAGATDYVTKPFDFLELRSRMSAAQRLVQERRLSESAAPRASGQKPKLPLEEAVIINGVDRVLKYNEFDNYIMQLSQGRLFNTHAMAVKISDVEELHRNLPRDEFEAILRDCAKSIATVTKKTGDIIAYRGNGVFLMVRHGKFTNDKLSLETNLNKMVLSRQAQRQAVSEAQIITGEPVSLRSLSKSGSLMSISRAVELVDMREQVLREEQRVPKAAFSGPGLSSEQEHLRKRAYQSVLRDLFRDEPTLRSE